MTPKEKETVRVSTASTNAAESPQKKTTKEEMLTKLPHPNQMKVICKKDCQLKHQAQKERQITRHNSNKLLIIADFIT